MAGGHKTSGESLGHTQANTVGKDERMQRLIKRILAQEPGETRARSETLRRNSQREYAETSPVRVQRFVSCIAQQSAGHGRQVNVSVLRQNQRGYEQIRQHRLVEVVAQLEAGVVLAIDLTFNLKRRITQVSPEQRIFRVALQGETRQRTPFRAEEMGLRVSRERALIEPGK